MSSANSACKGIATWLISLRTWGKWSVALILGAFVSVSQPPVHFVPALLVSFTGLVWLLDGTTSWRSAFGIGWLFGAGHFAAGLYWKRSSGDIETSIITREAVSSLHPIHNRSPLLLTKKQRDLWVSNLSSEEIYTKILDYTYDDIEFHKVDRAVNNPKNNNDSLIQRFEEVPF